jgi:putative component of membrane protein insertase Oxa1/YidC/SpoIIIJ protein YidD
MATLVLSGLAVQSIAFYQRYLSPRKGFRCANRAAKRGWSCSQFGKRVFERYPIALAYALLKRRLSACRGSAVQMAVVSDADTKDGANEDAKRKKNSLVDFCDAANGCDPTSMAAQGCDGCDIGAASCF